MRKLACLLLLAGGMLGIGGCASPAYKCNENIDRIVRSWDYDLKQAADDFYYQAMFIPPSHSTKWNLR
jgi:hypothetical protein